MKTTTVLEGGRVVVVAPADHGKVIVPFMCPVCEYPMKTADDAESYRRYCCCSMCELVWARSGIEVPNKEDKRWISYLERRHRAFIPQVNFK